MKNLSAHRYMVFWLTASAAMVWFGYTYVSGSVHERESLANQSPSPSLQPAVPFRQEFPKIEKKSRGVVTFYFDDAWLSEYSNAAPILKKAGFVGALAVPTGVVGWKNYATWDQIHELQRDGWEITNHTVAHNCLIKNWDAGRIKEELLQARDTLWRNNLPSEHFVSPCGVTSPQFVDVVKHEFVSFRGTQPGYNDLNHLNPFDMRVQNLLHTTTLQEVEGWINEAVRRDAWLILVFHQVGEQLPPEKITYAVDANLFSSIANSVKSRNLQVILPTQAFQLGHIQPK